MIFTERTITVVNDSATINKPLILYRGDKNIELKITIVESQFKFRSTGASNVIETANASYAQLVINTPYDLPIFSEVTATENGTVIFVITEAMIDEVREVGIYDIQIRLLDDSKQSRASVPPVSNAIEIREPMAIEDGSPIDSNVVNVAKVNRALTTTSAPLEVFDSQGNYIKKTWGDGDPITDAALNKMEAGIEGVNNKAKNIPTSLSQLTNDANFVNETFVNDAIAGITGVSTVEPAALDMPKVFFYGSALPTTKDNVNLTMDYISNTAKFSSFIKLKCQGTSSMSYAKKNFTVTMFSDEARETKLKKDFKGWGAQSKFCLKANYVDTTHTRNISGARIAYDMVASRPDSEFKQQLLQCPRNGAVDGFPIKLYFNGEFYGIYTWNIPKDGWMFNMDKSNPNHVVLCAERNTDGNANAINSCQFRKLWTDGDGGDWSVEFGTYSTDMVASLNRCINFVMTSTDQEFHDNIGEYFDLYSLLDYYCFSYLTCHLDGLAKNMLMATYDGVIWGACLYDMDSIYGVHWNGNSYVATNYQCPEQYQEQFSLLWKRIEANFGAELYARYRELRRGALSLSNIIKHVEEIYDVIPDRVFADEKAKWTSLPQVNTNTMTRFRNYMRDRAVYVDAQMQEIGTRVPCTGIVLGADTLSFTTTDTQTLSVVVSPDNCTETIAWSVSPSGIVTVKNGVVTPIRNGEATITATCGSYSDTCAVTVSGMSESGGDTGDYTDISYIESTGTQYINTHIVPTTSTKIELVAEMSASEHYDHIFGSDNFMKVQWMDDIGTALYATKKNNQNQISGLTLGKHTYVMDMTDTANAITIDGTNYGTNIGIVESTTNPLLLLSGYNNGTVETEFCGIGKIYSCKIYYEDTLVANMKPILTNSGTYGLLDTVNNTFYGSEVGSFTGGGTPSGGDTDIYTTAEYAITEPRTFNGTSDYIDTGIKLFDTAKDFTLYIDYASTAAYGAKAVAFHCIHEVSPWRGLCLMKIAKSDTYFIGGQAGGQNSYITDMPSSGKYLISFVNGVINNIVTVDNSDNLVYSATDIASDNPYVQISENLLIGCYQDTSGTKGRYWTGTINKFGVWYKQLTDAEINEVFGISGGDTNYLANASWQDGTININATGMTESTDDKYTSVQIPEGRYTLTSTNATWKKYRLSDSEGNVISHNNGGSNDTNDIIIDTSVYDDTIFTLEVSYYKPNDTIEVPSLMLIAAKGNVTTLTLDGSLSYNFPEWSNNPSGENGQVNVEIIISGITSIPSSHNLKGYTSNANLASAPSKGLAKQYMVSSWNGRVYLSFTLDMSETGVTNDIESVTNYLSNNPLTFKYII